MPDTPPKPPTLRQTQLPDAFAGVPFHASVQAADGYGEVVMTLRNSLPSGLTMQTGAKTLALSGVPESPGTFDLEVEATDSYGNTASRTYMMRVLPHPLSSVPNAVVSDAETIHTTDTDHVFFPAVIKTTETIHSTDADSAFMPVIINVKESITAADVDNHFSPAMIAVPESIHTSDAEIVTTKIGVTPTTAPAGSYNVGYSQNFTAVGNTGTATLTPAGTLPTGMSFSGSGSSRNLSGIPTQVGTFPFTITAKDSVNTSVVSYSLVINEGTQNITFPQPPTPITYYTGESVMLTASSSAGASYPVSYSVTGPATLSGSVLTYTGTGTVTVTANQAGDGNYNAATPVQVSITVQAKPGSIFVANSNGTVASLLETGVSQSSAVTGGGIGVAVDSLGYVWSINTGGAGLTRFTDTGTSAGTYTPSGISGATALAIDGNSNLWILNGTSTVLQVSNAGTTLSTVNRGTNTPATGVAIDQAGSVWVANGTDNSVTKFIGAAAPTASLTNAVVNNASGTKP